MCIGANRQSTSRRWRRGGKFSLVARDIGEPATRLLQDRVHLATLMGSPGGPKLVASSSATCNTCVAGSAGPISLRETGGCSQTRPKWKSCVGVSMWEAKTGVRPSARRRKLLPQRGLRCWRFSLCTSTSHGDENPHAARCCAAGGPLQSVATTACCVRRSNMRRMSLAAVFLLFASSSASLVPRACWRTTRRAKNFGRCGWGRTRTTSGRGAHRFWSATA